MLTEGTLTCLDKCTPTGGHGGVGCTQSYCDFYKLGGKFRSRCTAGAVGHSYAVQECAATCGLCDNGQWPDEIMDASLAGNCHCNGAAPVGLKSFNPAFSELCRLRTDTSDPSVPYLAPAGKGCDAGKGATNCADCKARCLSMGYGTYPAKIGSYVAGSWGTSFGRCSVTSHTPGFRMLPPTPQPTNSPTVEPTTPAPTHSPTTRTPTVEPTPAPIPPTPVPTPEQFHISPGDSCDGEPIPASECQGAVFAAIPFPRKPLMNSKGLMSYHSIYNSKAPSGCTVANNAIAPYSPTSQ